MLDCASATGWLPDQLKIINNNDIEFYIDVRRNRLKY